MKPRRFTSEEDEYLLAHAATVSPAEMARVLGRDQSSVWRRMVRLENLHGPIPQAKRSNRPFTDEEDRIICARYPTSSAEEIARALGRVPATVYNRIRRLKEQGEIAPERRSCGRPMEAGSKRGKRDSACWLAGVFDSSGYVRKRVRLNLNTPRLDCALVVTGDTATLREVMEITGLGTIHARSSEVSSDWIIYKHEEIRQVGNMILPHLRIKRDALKQLLDLLALPRPERAARLERMTKG